MSLNVTYYLNTNLDSCISWVCDWLLTTAQFFLFFWNKWKICRRYKIFVKYKIFDESVRCPGRQHLGWGTRNVEICGHSPPPTTLYRNWKYLLEGGYVGTLSILNNKVQELWIYMSWTAIKTGDILHPPQHSTGIGNICLSMLYNTIQE